MTKTLLASAALIFAFSTTSFAAAPITDVMDGFKAKTEQLDQEAKRRKPRVPGGSGCDSPRDIAEHPECTPKPAAKKKADLKSLESETLVQEAKRRKPRVPGGSGCDSPRDIAEHPECTPKPAAKKKADLKSLESETLVQEAKRRKPRVPGGSGCDSPRDVAQRPECRV